jgi:PHD/YefM family antitoxin component YafN of YafNO toxin-antitoxin module
MKLKTVSVEQLARQTNKVISEARKHPVLVRANGKPALILRPLVDDDAVDELLLQSPSFRASIRAARAGRAAGKSISLKEARRRLKA